MRNSESFETIESQILDSATLVSCNGEGCDDSLGSEAEDLDFEDDGILIMPPDFEEKDGHDISLSLPESVPSAVESFTAANNKEANDEDNGGAQKITQEHVDKKEDCARDQMSEEDRILINSEFIGARSGVTWIGYLCFAAMLLIHILTFYTKSGVTIQPGNPSFQISYDEALSRVRVLEKQVCDLETLQKKDEELRKSNVHLGDLVHSMRKVQQKNDALRTENQRLEEKLELSNLSREKQDKNLTALMNEVNRLTIDVMTYRVRNKEAKAQVKKSFNSLASLSEERDRLLRKNRRLQGQLKKVREKLDQEEGNSKESFPWETTDETKHPIIDNCWVQVDLGECSNNAKSSLHEGTQKVTESLRNAQATAYATFSDIKDVLKDSAFAFFSSESENDTSRDSADYYDKVKKDSAEYYDKVQDNVIEFVSDSVESMKKNEHIKSIGNTAKSVFVGVVSATAATVIISSAFAGGLFSEDSET